MLIYIFTYGRQSDYTYCAVLFTGDINLDFIFFAIQGDSDSVQALLDNGADVNAKENCGGIALMYVKEVGDIQIIKLLKVARAKE